MALHRQRRARILMDAFQYRLLMFNLLYFFTILMVSAAAIFAPLFAKLESSTTSLAEQREVATMLLSLHTRLWPAIVIVFVLLILHSVLVSHRIAGALYRFQIVFQEVMRGNLSARANLRKNDYLMKEASLINEMMVSLENRMTQVRDHGAAAEQVMTELHGALDREAVGEARQLLLRAETEMAHVRDSLAHFQTSKREETTAGHSERRGPELSDESPNVPS